MKNLKKGEKIRFYTSCNANRKLKIGVIGHHEGLGAVVFTKKQMYELRKLVDIKKK